MIPLEFRDLIFFHLWNLCIVVASAGLLIHISVATRTHFKMHERVPTGMKMIGLATLLGFVVFCGSAIEATPGALLPFACYFISLTVFNAAKRHSTRGSFTLAYSRDQPTKLVCTGPYKLVRHPFYLSYLIYWLANAAAVQTAASWLTLFVFIVIYVHAAREEEVKFAHSSLSETYATYRRRTKMLVPFVL